MKFIDKLERKFWKIWYSQSHNLHDCMLCDRLCTDDRESRHTELAEPGTSVYSAGTGMETGNLGTVSAEHLRVLWFAIAVLFFYYPIGTSLERTIGTLNIRCIFFRA